MERRTWDIKVTSKGQITLPKQVRDTLMIREGDHLQVVVEDNKMVLTRKISREDYGEHIRLWADRMLVELGYPDGNSRASLDPRIVRDKMPTVPVDLTGMVREEREKP